jgi:3-hydroxyisobutyrate dehydrogenase-like beta-hydroxyacid dehydrogenase
MTNEKLRVGFAGVGLMGHGMARHILEKGGYPLAVLGHRNREPVEDLVRRGATEAKDPAGLAAVSDVVVTCLPSAVEMEAVYLGPGGLKAGARPGTIFIDATTNDPDMTRKVGAALAAAGCHLVDAALGRTPKEVAEGRASTYVGGDPAVIAKVRPILESYADTIVVCGALGAGATCKLLNNSISMGMLMMISETFATAAKLGVDLPAFSEVLSAGGVNSGMWRALKPWIIDGDVGGLLATVRTGAKDMRAYTRMAEDAGVATPVAQAINQQFRLVVNKGHSDRMLPVLPGVLAELNGAKIREV